MKIIIGLGNPGDEYKLTRHNAGFIALDALTAKNSLNWSINKKCQAELAKKAGLVLIKPQSYMNNSGIAVYAVLSYYKLLPKKFGLFNLKNADLSSWLTVIHDDIDLPLSQYKISVDSRSAGHKGVQSVIDHLKTKNFTRVRLGIRAAAPFPVPTEKFVLQKFAAAELEIMKKTIDRALAEPLLQ